MEFLYRCRIESPVDLREKTAFKLLLNYSPKLNNLVILSFFDGSGYQYFHSSRFIFPKDYCFIKSNGDISHPAIRQSVHLAFTRVHL